MKAKRGERSAKPNAQEDMRTCLTQLYTDSKRAVPVEEVVNLLINRLAYERPYTRLGSSALVAIGNCPGLSPRERSADCEKVFGSEAAASNANKGYKEIAPSRTNSGGAKALFNAISMGKTESGLQPHIFDFATDVYFALRRTGRDQAVIASGLSGSGKSANISLFVEQVCLLAEHGKKDARLHAQVLAAQRVLDAFGSAKRIHTASGSRHGRYQELQINERGKVVGLKVMAFGFDKSRITKAPHDERNFDIVYQLLAGATAEERLKWHLPHDAPERYPYLAASRCYRAPGVDDVDAFAKTRDALKALGLKARGQSSIFGVLAAIVHLSTLTFIDDSNKNSDACAVRNTDVLQIVADLLGVQAPSLENALTYRSTMLGRELCTVFLNAEAAARQRDALAQALYSLLFAWIVGAVNKRLCVEAQTSFIALVDCPGQTGPKQLESPPTDVAAPLEGYLSTNYVDMCDFVLNLAAEKANHYALVAASDPTEASESALESDGVVNLWPGSQKLYPALQETMACDALLTDPLTGLAHIMSEECQRPCALDQTSQQNADASIVAAFGKAHAGNPKLFTGRAGDVRFVISHFSGPVTYAADRWHDIGADEVGPDFVNLFRSAGTLDSSFAAALFRGEGVATQLHPRDAKVVVSARQPSWFGRGPSLQHLKNGPRKGSVTEPASITGPPPPAGSAAVEVATGGAPAPDAAAGALRNIFETLSDTRAWALLCIRATTADSPVPNSSLFRYQSRLFGLPEIAARRAVADLFISLDHKHFLSRYKQIFASLSVGKGQDPHSSVLAVVAEGLSSDGARVGREKVWLTRTVWKAFEVELRSLEKEGKRSAADASLGGGGAGGQAAERGVNRRGSRLSLATALDNVSLQTIAPPYADDDNDSDYGGPSGDGKGRQINSMYLDYAASEVGDDTKSEFGWQSEMGIPGGEGDTAGGEKGAETAPAMHEDLVEESTISASRKAWVRTAWCLTWWIPPFCLSWRGMKRQDIQMAWREKVALCILIFFLCACIIFFIVGISPIVCPKGGKFSPAEVASHNSVGDLWVSLRGKVYDITFILRDSEPHGKTSRLAGVTPADMLLAVTGPDTHNDVTGHFQLPLDEACKGIWVGGNATNPLPVRPLMDRNLTDFADNQPGLAPGHPVQDTWKVKDPDSKPARDKLHSVTSVLPALKESLKGKLVIDIDTLAKGTDRQWFIVNKTVYDLTPLVYTVENRITVAAEKLIYETQVVDKAIYDMAKDFRFSGRDISDEFLPRFAKESAKGANPEWIRLNMNCLNSVFKIGELDERNSLKCQLNNYILFGSSILLVAVILVKFLAALQLGGQPNPEDCDKFVIIQVPCYTEGEDSLKKTLDSCAGLRYDDKRKLLFVICDGMIVGGGNDRATPKIVLDILGVDASVNPEPLAYRAIGDGSKQLNYGKIYSGLYEYEGHVVPYLVVVKVGKPSERARPGNRGKRDSQIILMNFLNRVHFDTPMSPMELEMYHQIKNVIGVHPSFYEYILMVDADTEVVPDSLNRLISCMMHDGRIMGLCGETQLANEDRSITTMMQVYEYYISHHLAKAFESLFGSVTCLPGCFCMYRIRTPAKGSPLIISNDVIADYSECIVDTLHKRNLLSLGEDRYLTTLMMKHFPNNKMTFTPDAICKTVAPDKWAVLLSQRRRWINSTIHNLLELMFLPELCGFCCFSMRFVVFIDLFGTLILPATVVYLAYLLYVIISGLETLPILGLILLVAVYGLQALVFIIKRQWQHIGWMVIYILAIPVFSFALPIYAFWHMDDFSWGTTRVVVGDNNKKQVYVTEEEKFDPRSIPLRKWTEYEAELWENTSDVSRSSRRSAASKSSHRSSASKASRGSKRRSSAASKRRSSARYVPGFGGPPSDADFVTSYIPLGVDPASFAGAGARASQPSAPALRPAGTPDAPPTDDELTMEIRYIIANENLMELTKKQIREKLQVFFGCDLSGRREFINRTVEDVLQGKI